MRVMTLTLKNEIRNVNLCLRMWAFFFISSFCFLRIVVIILTYKATPGWHFHLCLPTEHTCTAPNAQSPRSIAEWECGASVGTTCGKAVSPRRAHGPNVVQARVHDA